MAQAISMKLTLEFCFSRCLLMRSHSRQLAPTPIQKALPGACVFLYIGGGEGNFQELM